MDTEPELVMVTPPTPLSPSIPNAKSLNEVTALARFEFEPGKGNDGTKIMMVEWQDDDNTRNKAGSWNVSWPGKSTVFPADDEPADSIRRLYFLLPPGQIIPPHITIAYLPPKTTSTSVEQSEPLRMNVNPLPAIFTPELGATAKTSGKKGVLHTIWAKRRLQVLEKEIRNEQEHNLEGIALEMAVAEKEWIEQNFGLAPQAQRPSMTIDLSNLKSCNNPPQSPAIRSPKSPGGKRLSEKLKGLSITTSGNDLTGNKPVNTLTRELHPLSPEVGDMAVSSFSAFRDAPPSSVGSQNKRMISQAPPDFIKQQQQQNPAPSLDFVTQAPLQPFKSVSSFTPSSINDDPDDLFAVALSPRSPEDPKSPFSIPSSDVSAFTKIEG